MIAITRAFRPTPKLLCAAALAASPILSMAGITDDAGDFLPTFGGTSASTDLDVLSASVLFNSALDSFTLSATLSGPPGLTATGLYVWGVNRGAGTAGFAANGLPGILFDRVVLVLPNGTGSVSGTALDAGAVTISGNTITAVVRGALLPSTGFAESNYTWNLWPRNTAFTGFAQIADFAPDDTNFVTVPVAVPEPGSYALMLAGLGVVGWAARRRAKT